MKLLIPVLVLCVVYQAAAFDLFNLKGGKCGCNDEGVDICSGASCKKGGGVTAPRPYPIQPPRPAQTPLVKHICKEYSSGDAPKPFSPIGDICSCGKQIVKPAPLPNIKAQCTHHHHKLPKFEIPKPSCSCPSCLNLKDNSDNSDSSSKPSCDCGEPIRVPEHRPHHHHHHHHKHEKTVYLDSPKRKHAPAPQQQRYGSADVVSVAIAQRLANSAKNGISERQLQYGSLKEPTIPDKETSSNSKKVINVNEESFYSTNGDVLEIKANMFHRKPQISSEESESSEEEKPKKPEPFSPARLRYEDIGYGAYEQKHKPKYVVIKNSEPVSHDCSTKRPSSGYRHHHHHHHQKKNPSCNCYKDLVVDQSGKSEQSISYENNSSSGFASHFKSYST